MNARKVESHTANGLISLRFTCLNQRFRFYDGRLQKLVVAMCPPPMGDCLMIGFSTAGARILVAEWNPSARLPLVNVLRDGLVKLKQSAATRTKSRIVLSVVPEESHPLSFVTRLVPDDYGIEFRFTQGTIVARVLLDVKELESLVCRLETVSPGFKNVRLIIV